MMVALPHGTRLNFLKLGFRFSTKAVLPDVGFFAQVVELGGVACEVGALIIHRKR